jgi:hypothetical protein
MHRPVRERARDIVGPRATCSESSRLGRRKDNEFLFPHSISAICAGRIHSSSSSSSIPPLAIAFSDLAAIR